jgi:hypothetical protein
MEFEMPKVVFDIDTLVKMFEDEPCNKKGEPATNYQSCKDYINKYFYKCTNGEYFIWNAETEEFVFYDKTTLTSVYLELFPDELLKWFKKKNTKLYKACSDMLQPRIFGEKMNKLNLCDSLNRKLKKFEEYDDKIKEGVKKFITFIKEVLCDNNEDQLKYILQWIAYMLRGEKNVTLLYLRGEEGIGKSTFIEFLVKYVIRNKKLTLGSSTEPITTNYNRILLGKLLVYFEELPTFNAKEWQFVASKLKTMITMTRGDEMVYRDVYEKAFPAENTNNYIVVSNVEAIQGSDGRKFHILDLSTKYMKNHKYFEDLKNKCFNNDVGDAFMSYLNELDLSEYHSEKSMPITRAKMDAIDSRLESSFKFIKQEYYLKQQSILISPTDLHEQYLKWCKTSQDGKYIPRGRNEFNQQMKNLGFIYKRDASGNKYNISINEINEVATKRNWKHELDEFEHNTNTNNYMFDDENDKQIIALQEQIKQLQEQLKQQQKAPEQILNDIVNNADVNDDNNIKKVKQIEDTITHDTVLKKRSTTKIIVRPSNNLKRDINDKTIIPSTKDSQYLIKEFDIREMF